MSSTDERVLSTLRHMAWERAKGELAAVLSSYWGEMERFTKMDKAVSDLIALVEGEGWHE